MRSALLASAVALAGCQPWVVEYRDQCDALELDTTLVFARGSLDAPQELSLEVRSLCARDTILTLHLDEEEVAAGFEVPAGHVDLPAGLTIDIPVGWQPQGYAPARATVDLYSGIHLWRVGLAGQVEPDQDGDGHEATVAGGGDCDDTDPQVHPGATEVRDAVDQDCDGLADDGVVPWGAVLVSEVMVRPQAVGTSVGQWIELRNVDDVAVELGGWVLATKGGAHDTLESLRLEPGARAVLGASADSSSNGGVEVDQVWSGAIELGTSSFASLWLDGAPMALTEWNEGWVLPGRSLGLDPVVIDAAWVLWSEAWCAAETSMSGGDRGTPGEVNDRCATMDHDGDGWAQIEECDDDDPAVYPGAPELWNGADDDCDGAVDDSSLEDLALGWVRGSDGAPHPGLEASGIGAVDLGGDGTEAIVLLPMHGYSAYLLDHDAYSGSAGIIGAVAETVSASVAITAVAPRAGDHTGDGVPDLAVAYYEWTEEVEASGIAVFDGNAAAGADGLDEALVLDLDFTWAVWHLAADGDLDGDGVDDLVAVVERTWSSDQSTALLTLSGADLDGAVLEDAAVLGGPLRPSPSSDRTEAPATGDVDGDGYDDLVARGGTASVGACLVLSGPDAWGTGEAADLAGTLVSDSASSDFCEDRVLADLDGSGALDLAVSSRSGQTVSVFLDLGLAAGALEPSDADLEITGAAGFGAAIEGADLDGDGVGDLLVSAHGGSKDGEIFAFLSPGLASGDLDSFDADHSLGAGATGYSTDDQLGRLLRAADTDGDGKDEVVFTLLESYPFNNRIYLADGEGP